MKDKNIRIAIEEMIKLNREQKVYGFSNFITDFISNHLSEICHSEQNVLFYGDTGTGKGVVLY